MRIHATGIVSIGIVVLYGWIIWVFAPASVDLVVAFTEFIRSLA